METRAVTVADGIGWFSCGWRIFMRNPGLWIVLGLIFLAIVVVLSLIPFLGGLALALIGPVLMAGLLYAAREADAGRALDAMHVLQGFKEKDKVTPLLSLGGISVAAAVVSGIIVFALIGGSMMAASQGDGWPAHAPAIGIGAMLGGLLILTIQLAVGMALIYATPLIMFHTVALGEALRSSFRACLRNWLPLTVFGILYLVLAILASMPFMLGWILLLPVSVGMLYCSYRDFYEAG
jgi:uncharacterized membrane protein